MLPTRSPKPAVPALELDQETGLPATATWMAGQDPGIGGFEWF